MGHYDLYSSLGLERTGSSADIVTDLQRRLDDGRTDNPGGEEELRLASTILGDPEKRRLYDTRINDPDAPPVTISAIRELAALQPVGAPAPGPGTAPGPDAGSGRPSSFDAARERATEQAHKVSSEYKRSSRTALILTAVASLVVGALLASAAFVVFGNGGGSTGVDNVGDAEKKVQEFLDLRTADEARTWLGENSAAETRSGLTSTLSLNEGGNFAGTDAYFQATDPEVGYSVNMVRDWFAPMYRVTQERFSEAAAAEGLEDLVMVTVLDAAGVNVGVVFMAKAGDDWRMMDLTKADSADNIDLDTDSLL